MGESIFQSESLLVVLVVLVMIILVSGLVSILLMNNGGILVIFWVYEGFWLFWFLQTQSKVNRF